MRKSETSDLWWKFAVVCCLDIEKFCDANDDGVGDMVGLAQRIDHLAELGVTCLWLMPFYPTDDRDFYVWRDEPPTGTSDDVVFPDEETSLWAFEEKTGQYYLHSFYTEQPDLNIADPKVQ